MTDTTPADQARRGRRRSSRSAGPPVAGSGSAEQTVAGPAPRVAPTPATVERSAAPPSSADAADVSESSGGRSRRRTTVLSVLSALIAVVLVGAVVGFAWLDHQHSVRDTRRAAEIQAARQIVLNLTTIHPDTAKQDVERILADASGEFKAEFDGRIDPFVGIVTEAKVITNGEIIEAALEREYGNNADVLVAARSMVTNGNDAQPTPRDFRLRVTITESDGRYTTSKVEFVA